MYCSIVIFSYIFEDNATLCCVMRGMSSVSARCRYQMFHIPNKFVRSVYDNPLTTHRELFVNIYSKIHKFDHISTNFPQILTKTSQFVSVNKLQRMIPKSRHHCSNKHIKFQFLLHRRGAFVNTSALYHNITINRLSGSYNCKKYCRHKKPFIFLKRG